MRESLPRQNLWQARRVAVLGAGKSGRAAAALLHAQGACVTVLDDAAREEAQARLAKLGGLPRDIRVHAGGIRSELLRGAEWIVRSPGIPLRHPACVWAREQGIPIVTEIDVACAHLPDCTFIGVTGTNGKSTTTCMLGRIFKSLRDSGRRDAMNRVSPEKKCPKMDSRRSLPLAPNRGGNDKESVRSLPSAQNDQENKGALPLFVGGNLGTPLCEAVLAGANPAWAVLELSSFQLQNLRDLRLAAAIVTNIGVDHTREHGSHESYVRAKARIVELLRPGGVLVCRPCDLELLPSASLCARGGTVWRVEEECSIPLPGSIVWKHDRANAAMAASAAVALGVPPSVITTGLAAYRGLPHRFEPLGESRGVRFINDSKATNVGATVAALKSVGRERVHLILGGQDKGESYKPLRDACGTGRVTVYAIGDEAAAIKRCLAREPPIPCVFAGMLARAVDLAWRAAVPGETILLAPACPSFDQFANFAARGEAFRNLFQRLRADEQA